MHDVLSEIVKWTERGDRIALATVVGVKRSAPRAPGAKMAVSDSGRDRRWRLRAAASRVRSSSSLRA